MVNEVVVFVGEVVVVSFIVDKPTVTIPMSPKDWVFEFR